MDKKIKHIKIEAENNYEFGFKLGKALSKNIQRRIEENKKIYKREGMHYSKLVKEAKKFVPAIQKKYPHLLKELHGMRLKKN